MQKLRIFVDAHCFDREYQGSRTFIQEIYSRLGHKQDLEIYLAACDIRNLQRIFASAPSIRFLKYNSSSRLVRLLWDMPYFIRKYQMQVSHMQYVAPFYNPSRQVVTVHDLLFRDHPEHFPYLYRKSRDLVFRRSVIHADAITTVSEHSVKSIERHFQVRADRVNLIPNGVDEIYFQPADTTRSISFIQKQYGIRNYILCVSRIEPRKNIHALIRAWSELRLYQNNIPLVVIGHPSIPDVQIKKAMEADPAASPYLHFLENLPGEDLLHFYRAARCFVYPSLAEGFGIPPLEAAACGTPVICSNRSAMKAYTFFGDNHIDPADVEMLKNRIQALLEQKDYSYRAAQIRRCIKQHYSWDRSAEKLYRLFKHQSITK